MLCLDSAGSFFFLWKRADEQLGLAINLCGYECECGFCLLLLLQCLGCVCDVKASGSASAAWPER